MAAHVAHPSGQSLHLGLWLSVILHRPSLDRRLAGGEHPSADAALALRSQQLTSRKSLDGLAIGIERILEAAEEPPPLLTSQAPLRRAEILRTSPELRALAGDLRAARDPSPAGPAMVMQLFRAPDSPLFSAGLPGNLWAAARRARDALGR